MGIKKQKVCCPDFKTEAMRLAQSGEVTLREAAKNLGVGYAILHDWVKKAGARKSKFVRTTNSKHRMPVAESILGRNFNVANMDITNADCTLQFLLTCPHTTLFAGTCVRICAKSAFSTQSAWPPCSTYRSLARFFITTVGANTWVRSINKHLRVMPLTAA